VVCMAVRSLLPCFIAAGRFLEIARAVIYCEFSCRSPISSRSWSLQRRHGKKCRYGHLLLCPVPTYEFTTI
jgi:hypothetical protein